MEQNGSFFMTESFDEEENGFSDDFEKHKVRNGKLENGHRKHLKKPRNSLHEFEQMENKCNLQNGHAQSAGEEGIFNGYERHAENDRSISLDSQDQSESSFGGSTFDKEELRRIEKAADMSFNNSREDGRVVGNGYWNNGYGVGDGSDVHTLSDGAPPDEDQDPSSEIIMQKYMEETPRTRRISSGIPSSPHFSDGFRDSPGGSPSHGQAFEGESNTNFNNNKGVPLEERLEEVTNSSRKSDGLFSLSQEQPPSHLEEFEDDEDSTDEQSELVETAIPAGLEEVIQKAAQNVQEFGSETEDRHSERQSESSVSLGKVKPVAVSGHKRKKSRGSSSRSSQEGSSRSRHRHSLEAAVNNSEASMIAEEEVHVGRKDLGDPGLQTKEESSLKQRLSSRIPALNLQYMTDTESDPDNPTPRSKEELSSRLSEERKTRRQTTQVVEQLQLDYDELLAKYAQAENTIDQLRLGAKVNLYSDLPPRGQSSAGTLTPAKQPQKFELATPQRAGSSRTANSRDVTASSGMVSSTGGGGGVPHEDTLTSQRVSHDMRLTVANLTQQIPLLKRAVDTNQVPVAEQQELFNQLKQTHGQLEEEYMQRMEEVKEQQRWSSVLPDSSVEQFDPEKSLEGKIFQVGMQLEDLQETVEENVRKNPPEISTPSRHSGSRRQSFHQDIPKEVANPQLPPEYIQLLQKYETLKQLPANPKRDQEIQKLVKEIDNLQVTPQNEENYMSERSEVSSSSRRRSSRRKERAASSGRGTPSSARSLERQKSDSEKEILSRNSKKAVEPISIPMKTAGTPGDSGSSYPRSPEHEIDSGFVGSEGSRQSQQSKQNYIPSGRTTSGSHRTHTEPGTHKSGARIKRMSHHTPIQELSERGQQSSSQSSESRRRSGHSQKPKPVSTSSEEEEETYKKGLLERQSRTHRRSTTPSSHHSFRQQQIHSPLPSKPKVEDFQRRSSFSPPKRSLPSQRNASSSSKVSSQPSKPVRSEVQGSKRSTDPKSSSSSKTKVDPRIERLRRRRDSDIGSSGSKSVRSEEVLALQREVAALKQQLHPSVGRGSLQSQSVMSEEDEHNETEGASEDDGYMVGRSRDGYEMNSVQSSHSSKSERLAELRAEMDQLKEDLLQSRETGVKSRRKLAPSATSTPASEKGRRIHKLSDWEEEYEGYPSPIRERTEPMKERDILRETLRRKYIPIAKSPRPVRSSKEGPNDFLSSTGQDGLRYQRQRQKNLIRPSELSHNENNTFGYSRTGHDHPKADPVFNPLSSLGTSPYVPHQKSSPQQAATTLPCQHCNGSGIHHSHPETGQRFTHQSPAMQQTPTTFVQPPSNTTVFVPNSNPVYHSTHMVYTPGTPGVVQEPLMSQVPLTSFTQQQSTPGTVIGGTTMVPPQGNLTYAAIPSTVPMTVLSSSPQVKVPQQVISVSPQEQSTTHGAAANGARPVYLVPSSKGRYYIKDGPAVEDSDVEEIIYRRTPVKRTPSGKSKQVEFHSQVHLEESDIDETLYAAYQMAQRLKRSSEKVLESAQSNLQKAGLRKQLDFY